MQTLPSDNGLLFLLSTGSLTGSAATTPGPAAVVAALPRSVVLPSQVASVVPACAQSCLSYYISQQYANICDTGSDDASCLCTRYSQGGYALGELGYLCVSQQCDSAARQAVGKVYTICNGFRQAATPTHATLTILYSTSVTRAPTAPTQLPSSSRSSITSVTTTRSQTQTSSSGFYASPTTSPLPPSTTTTTLNSTATGLPAAGADTSSNSLTSAQAVGAAIGAFSGLVAALGLIYLLVWLRRRKRDRTLSDSHYEKAGNADQSGPSPPSPPPLVPFDRLQPASATRTFNARAPTQFQNPHGTNVGLRPFLLSSMRQDGNLGIGHAAMSSQRGPQSHVTQRGPPYAQPDNSFSQDQNRVRRISQLLPDNPTHPPAPAMLSPARLAGASRRLSNGGSYRSLRSPAVHAPATIPEEGQSLDPYAVEGSAPPPPAPKDTFNFHNMDNSLNHPALSMARGAVLNPATPQKPSNLSLNIPSSHTQQSSRDSPLTQPIMTQTTPIRRHESGLDTPRRPARPAEPLYHDSESQADQQDSILRYYETATPNESAAFHQIPRNSPATNYRIHNIGGRSPSGTQNLAANRTRKPPQSDRKLVPGKIGRRDSASSDTSFESACADEPTPPDEADRRLDTVNKKSPLSNLKYPRAPGSVNQLVPRSPPPSDRDVYLNDRQGMLSNDEGLRDSSVAYGAAFPVTPQRQNTTDSNLSGSTLAAKRQGDSVARDLERMLDPKGDKSGHHSPYQNNGPTTRHNFRQPYSRHESPLKGYGRGPYPARGFEQRQPINNMMQTNPNSEVVPKTPSWEPVFTPRRHGDDLYLSVN